MFLKFIHYKPYQEEAILYEKNSMNVSSSAAQAPDMKRELLPGLNTSTINIGMSKMPSKKKLFVL